MEPAWKTCVSPQNALIRQIKVNKMREEMLMEFSLEFFMPMSGQDMLLIIDVSIT